jgi:hypothetical protein
MNNALTTRIQGMTTARLENVVVYLANDYTVEADMISQAAMDELFNRYGKDAERWSTFVERVELEMN